MTTRRAPSKIIPRAFPGIKPGEVEELIANSQVHAYAPGTALCKENAIEDTFYVILDGEAKVTKIINNTEVRLLKTLRPGDFFGEMALIHNAPRAATVTAKTQVVVLELNKEAFDRVLKHSSSVALTMVREISNRLRENDEMAVEDLRLRAGELAQAYQQLAEQELARREFLSNIAHELRTPLMAASGFLQLIQNKIVSPDELDTTLDTVAHNIQKINTLVNDILFLQEMDLVLPDFQPVDIDKITRRVKDAYDERAQQQSVKLHIKTDRPLPLVAGDAESLERAITCLVDNAVKFSPRGGDVDIRVGTKDGRVFVSVQDHGIGITDESRPFIFDRFYHLEKSDGELFGGLGIGLAITRQVIKQHDGTLDVESKPGQGSTFTMTLNAAK
ncbi:MAG: cyclic nucleotide-binding domain-containing protein [Chloroflexi bacterium]|nr:cyclic nucleotide-binding domain-containing protein [Chloroflexota bacterium]